MPKDKSSWGSILGALDNQPKPKPKGSLSLEPELDEVRDTAARAMNKTRELSARIDEIQRNDGKSNVTAATALSMAQDVKAKLETHTWWAAGIGGVALAVLVLLYQNTVATTSGVVAQHTIAWAEHDVGGRHKGMETEVVTLRARLAAAQSGIAVLQERLKSTATCQCDTPAPADAP